MSEQYVSLDARSMLRIEAGVYRTYILDSLVIGDPIYTGRDPEAARESLGLDDKAWYDLLMRENLYDPEDEDNNE